jgi:hypothetical protein
MELVILLNPWTILWSIALFQLFEPLYGRKVHVEAILSPVLIKFWGLFINYDVFQLIVSPTFNPESHTINLKRILKSIVPEHGTMVKCKVSPSTPRLRFDPLYGKFFPPDPQKIEKSSFLRVPL